VKAYRREEEEKIDRVPPEQGTSGGH